MDLACSQCGHRQAAGNTCAACGSDTVHDLRSARTRELLEDIDLRLGQRRDDRIRGLSVVGAMVIVIAAWFVPGYWALRGMIYPGLPLLFDQWILMVIVALGLMKVSGRWFPAQRFPYLATLPPTTLP